MLVLLLLLNKVLTLFPIMLVPLLLLNKLLPPIPYYVSITITPEYY